MFLFLVEKYKFVLKLKQNWTGTTFCAFIFIFAPFPKCSHKTNNGTLLFKVTNEESEANEDCIHTVLITADLVNSDKNIYSVFDFEVEELYYSINNN